MVMVVPSFTSKRAISPNPYLDNPVNGYARPSGVALHYDDVPCINGSVWFHTHVQLFVFPPSSLTHTHMIVCHPAYSLIFISPLFYLSLSSILCFFSICFFSLLSIFLFPSLFSCPSTRIPLIYLSPLLLSSHFLFSSPQFVSCLSLFLISALL